VWPLIISCIAAVAVIFILLAIGGNITRAGAIISSIGGGGSLGNLPEVVAAVLGIAITVVAIIVELAANRYTPRIADLFFREPANSLVLGFFVLVCIECIWAATLQASGADSGACGMLTLVLTTMSFVILLPYFAYVFAFLDPVDVVRRISDKVLKSIRRIGDGQSGKVERSKVEAINGIEQIADVALNAIDKKDKGISISCITALGRMTRAYDRIKKNLPAEWFGVNKSVLHNADFVSLQENVASEIEARRTWFEMKVFRQFQMIYNDSLNRLRDLAYVVAIETRLVGEKAMMRKDTEVLKLAVKYFNTFMRATINSGDVRTAYNLLNQYRLLIECTLKAGEMDIATDCAVRFRDYGQLAFNAGLPFILETAAYDLCTVNELAYDLDADARDRLLEIFLTVDKEAEAGHEHEESLRGVRKAQVKLATYYLKHGEKELARNIFEDMKAEIPERLASIRDELMSISEKDFWEITDRGINFDYLEPARKETLNEFFGWFGDALPPVKTGVKKGAADRPTGL